MHRALKPVLGLLGAAAMGAAIAGGSIDTTPSWNGTTNAAPFGEADTATFGQSITTDAAGGRLQSFTFYLGPLNLDIRGYVYEWDGSKAVGSALYASNVFNIGDQFTGFKPTTVVTPDVPLSPDKQYVLFFSSSGLQVGRFNTGAWGALTTSAYSGGEFVFHNSSNDFSSLFSASGWDCSDGCGFMGNGADLAFKAEIHPLLSSVPESTEYSLMLVGLCGLALTVSLRRQL